jgi:hypothetical protein
MRSSSQNVNLIFFSLAQSAKVNIHHLQRRSVHRKHSLSNMLLSPRITVKITKIAYCGWGSAADPVYAHANAFAMYCPYDGILATPLPYTAALDSGVAIYPSYTPLCSGLDLMLVAAIPSH